MMMDSTAQPVLRSEMMRSCDYMSAMCDVRCAMGDTPDPSHIEVSNLGEGANQDSVLTTSNTVLVIVLVFSRQG